jgi:O-antigen biosynthesis protein
MFNRYFGKIIAVLRQEGFFRGLKKFISAGFLILRPAGSGDVLFISSGVIGDSFRYRVLNICQELQLHGFRCSSVVQEYPNLLSRAGKFKVFVFHKVSNTPHIQKFVEEIKKQNKEIIFETDDLLFEPEFVREQDFFKNANQNEQKFFENGIGGEILSDPYVKVCTTSTTYLAEKLRGHGKQVFVVPNKLSKKDVEIAAKVQTSNVKRQTSIRIGYFSGTHSHNKDFATITEALVRIMEKYSSVELFLVGPLDVESELNKFSKRIKQFPYVPREKHFKNIASVDINIAPLEIGNPFCESRSELKFFEAAIVKVPTVAAATQTFCEAIEDGIDGFVASTDAEWFEKLEKLIVNKEVRKAMAEKAYQKALKKYSVENSNNEEYYEYLRDSIKS